MTAQRTFKITIADTIASLPYSAPLYGITFTHTPIKVWLNGVELTSPADFSISYQGESDDVASSASVSIATTLAENDEAILQGDTTTDPLVSFADDGFVRGKDLNASFQQLLALVKEEQDSNARTVRFETPAAPEGIPAVDASVLSNETFDTSRQYFLAAQGIDPTRFALSPVVKAIIPPHHELPTRAWQASETYEDGEVVFFEGRLYRANAEILPNNAIPPENNDWEGIDGGWRAVVEGGKGYEADDLVLYQGGLYHITAPFISSHAAADLQAQLAANAQHIAPIVATLDSLGLAEANTGKPLVSIGALEEDGYPIIVGTLYPNSDGSMVHSDTAFIPHTPFPDLPTAESLGLATAVLGQQSLSLIDNGQGGNIVRLTYSRLDETTAQTTEFLLPTPSQQTLTGLGLQERAHQTLLADFG